MNDQQLRIFLSVARHSNFTEASREFYITQPAISRQISELEKELGTKLFHRTTRSVTLTKSGELFLEDTKRILSLASSARERIRLADANQDLLLKIIYLSSPTRTFLPRLVYQFHQAYPQVSIELHSRTARGIGESMKEGKEDLYFSISRDMATHHGYTVRNLFTDSFCLVCKNDHPCLEDSSPDFEKIATEPFLMFQAETAVSMNRAILSVCKELNFAPRITNYYDSMDDVIFAAESGLGITILPYKTRFYAPDSLTCIPLQHNTPGSTIGVSWNPENENPAVSWFLELLSRMQEENPGWF